MIWLSPALSGAVCLWFQDTMHVYDATHTMMEEEMIIDPCPEFVFFADDAVMSDVAWQLWQDLYSIRRNEIFLGILQTRHNKLAPTL